MHRTLIITYVHAQIIDGWSQSQIDLTSASAFDVAFWSVNI